MKGSRSEPPVIYAGERSEKRGEPDKMALAKEVEDVIKTALNIARYYRIEQELKNSIDTNCQKFKDW